MSKNLNKENVAKEITWEKRISLITNRYVLQDFLKAFGISYLIMVVLMGVIFLSQGDIEVMVPMLYIFALVNGGLFILSLLIMALFFGNSFNFRFTLNNKGVLCEIIDRKAKMSSNLAIIAGLLTGRSGTLGAGLVAKSQETTFIHWKGLIKLIPDEKRKTIALRNSWRRVMVVYTSESNYQEVLQYINKYVVTLEERKVKSIKSPLPGALLQTFFIILASIPIFLELPYPFEIDLLVPIFILCFAQATLWLNRFMAYPVLLGVAYSIITIFYIGFQKYESLYFFKEGSYTNFEMVSSWEWPPLIILFICLGYFTWFSLSAIKGKLGTMLEKDLLGEQ